MTPTTIVATLILDNDADPPASRLNVQIDGLAVAARDISPAELVGALAVIAPEAEGVWAPAQALVARLESAVKTGASAQTARRKSLTEWQEALAAVPPPPDS